MRSLKEDLIAARAVIEKPEAWTKDTFAKDADGEDVMPEEYAAVCWCTLGATRKATGGGDGWRERFRADRHLEAHLPSPFETIPEFNDDPKTTHADILALFDRAIAAQDAPVAAAPESSPDAN